MTNAQINAIEPIRGSALDDFLHCRKKWKYSWVDRIEPKNADNKLFFGSAFHKFLESLYSKPLEQAHDEMSKYVVSKGEGMDEVEYQELLEMLKQTSNNYIKEYYEKDKKWKVLAVELKFSIRISEDVVYEGTIDLVYEDEFGQVWFADHKTAKQVQMYVDKALMDRQSSRYWWVLARLAENVPSAKVFLNGEWQPFTAIHGKRIQGFLYNIIKKDYPVPPEILKSGKLSVAKNQKTTYDLYLEKIRQLNLNPADYDEFLRFLNDKPNDFFKRIEIVRSEAEQQEAMIDVLMISEDINELRNADEERLEYKTYRNITDKCSSLCQFRPICFAAVNDSNVDLVIKNEYKAKEKEQCQ